MWMVVLSRNSHLLDNRFSDGAVSSLAREPKCMLRFRYSHAHELTDDVHVQRVGKNGLG